MDFTQLQAEFHKPAVKYSVVGVGVAGLAYIAYKRFGGGAAGGAVSGGGYGQPTAAELAFAQQTQAQQMQYGMQQQQLAAGAAANTLAADTQVSLSTLQAQENIQLAQINQQNIGATLNATTSQQANAINGTIAADKIISQTQLGLSGNQLTSGIVSTGAGLIATGSAANLVRSFGSSATPATASAIAQASMPAASIAASASPVLTVAADGTGLGSLTTAATAANISPLGTFAATTAVDTATTGIGAIAASDAVAAGLSSGAVTAAAYGAADYAGAAVVGDAVAGAAAASSGFSLTSLLSAAACFITTAACEYRGLKDDCHALQSLRGFRDDFMLKHYPEAVREYYDNAPRIVAAIKRRPDADKIFGGFFDFHIVAAVNAIENEEYFDAYHIYRNLYRKAERMSLENVATV